jgi:predicted acetyltransferase
MNQEAALPVLQAVYRQFSGPASGMLHRGTFYWEIMLRRSNDQHTYIAVYFDESDQPSGYCLYRTRWQDPASPEPSHVIDVFDFSWLNIEAYRGLWEYLGAHDLADRIRMEFVAEDDPAPNMLLEPRMLRRNTWDGVWMRVVDVEQALSIRGYDFPGEVTVQIVDDDLCGWNNGSYRLSTSGDATDVERLSKDVQADIVAGPDAFASLISGHTRPSDLARMGRLAVGDDADAVQLDYLFSTRRRPTCPNMF